MAAHSMPAKAFDRLPFQDGKASPLISLFTRVMRHFERWSHKRLGLSIDA